ncbi:RNA-directed DNA polymerase, eukaryota [Tanacetum coccineum]
MGSQRSKEDEVQKISTSLFFINFPDLYTAKDLFNTCTQYGNVVDAFIPNKISKACKRLGFVRFIKVFDVERLVNNLCTVWVGHYKLYANIVRFQRTPLNKDSTQAKNKYGENGNNTRDHNKDNGVKGFANSYAHVVKGGSQPVNVEVESTPTLVLLKFASEKSKKLFHENVGVSSWFSQLQLASMNFIIDERITWVEIEGILFKLWSENTFKRIASKWGVVLHVDDQEDGCFHKKSICIKTKVKMNIFESFKIIFHGKIFWIRAKEVPGWVSDHIKHNEEEYDSDCDSKEGDLKGGDVGLKSCSILGEDSDVKEVSETKFEEVLHKSNMEEASVRQMDMHSEDLFKIYDLLNKKHEDINKGPSLDNSLKYPLGFTPTDVTEEKGKKNGESEKESSECSHKVSKKGPKEDVAESICSGHFKKSEIPRTCGSILHLMDELVKVGQIMGYNMEGCLAQKAKKDWVKEICVKNKVNFLSLQEAKIEDIELFSVKMCWGNFAFDYINSASVENSGGILCVWDPSSFHKINATVSDYFVMIRGVWVKNGEVVIMGDFNKVCKNERFGSLFNMHGANTFNSFIFKVGLEEVLLVITLDRYLSDHRPILLRESQFDYGPIPFRVFHYWFEMEGFDKLVEDAWKGAHVEESNAVVNMMKKLIYLKQKIREWNNDKKKSAQNVKQVLKRSLLNWIRL